MPQSNPLSGKVLPLCHRVSSPEECGLATFWLLIVCVKSMSGAHVLCFEEMATGANFFRCAIKFCTSPEECGLANVLALNCLCEEHGVWIAVGVSLCFEEMATGARFLPTVPYEFLPSRGVSSWITFWQLNCSCVPPYVAVSRKHMFCVLRTGHKADVKFFFRHMPEQEDHDFNHHPPFALGNYLNFEN